MNISYYTACFATTINIRPYVRVFLFERFHSIMATTKRATTNQSHSSFVMTKTTASFFFFGDVEPDTVATNPQTINVWRAAAPKIPHKLSTIFIECSWPSGRHKDLLYGHLSPEHLVDELMALAIEIVKFKRADLTSLRPGHPRKKQKKNPISQDDLRGTLEGVVVYVMHCKDDLTGDSVQPMRHIIVPQVRSLVEEKGLGAQILVVEPGMHIKI